MPKTSRWTKEKRYEIVMEMLPPQEPVAQIARQHQVSEGLLYRWRDLFFERGRKAVLTLEVGGVSRGQKKAFKQQIEELQKLLASPPSKMAGLRFAS